MNIIQAIQKRKSIRAFKPDPVPRELLQAILETACRAPSAMNIQPWEFVVIAGQVLDRIREANIAAIMSGAPAQPEHLVTGWPKDSIYRMRQVELAKGLFKLMGIEREDSEKRLQWMQRGFRYFDAPAAILVLADRMLGENTPLVDIGAVVQSICLAALHYDLGTCIEDQGIMYPHILREHVSISDSKRIIIGVAIGYPDMDFPANQLVTSRESVANNTTWYGFDDSPK